MIPVEETRCPTFCVIDVGGPLDIPRARQLRRHVRACLRAGKNTIVINLDGVTRIDAFGVGELVGAYNLATAANGTLRIVEARAWVREILVRVGLFNILSGEAARAGTASQPRQAGGRTRHACSLSGSLESIST